MANISGSLSPRFLNEGRGWQQHHATLALGQDQELEGPKNGWLVVWLVNSG